MTKRGNKKGYHNRQESNSGNKNTQGWKTRALYQIPEQEEQFSENFTQYQDLQYDNYQYRLRRTSRRGKTGRKHRHRMGGFQGTVPSNPSSEKVPNTPTKSKSNENQDERIKNNKEQFYNAMINYMFDKSNQFSEETKTHLEQTNSTNCIDKNLVTQKTDLGLLGISLTMSGMTLADVDDVPEAHRLMMATITQMTSNQSLAEATNIIYDGQGNLINLSVPPPNYYINSTQSNSANPLVYLPGRNTNFEQTDEFENSPTARVHDGILEKSYLPISNDPENEVEQKEHIKNQYNLYSNNIWTPSHTESICTGNNKISQELKNIINCNELEPLVSNSDCEQENLKMIEQWEINESQIIEISTVHVNDEESLEQSLLITYENQTMLCQATFINDEMLHQHDTTLTSVRQTSTISIISQQVCSNNDNDQLKIDPQINLNSIKNKIVREVSEKSENNKVYQINQSNWNAAFKPNSNACPKREYLYEFKKTAVNVPAHLKEKHVVKEGVWAERNIDSNEAFAEFQRRMTCANVIIGNCKVTTDNRNANIEKNDEENINFQCETTPKKILSPIGSKRKIDKKTWYPEFPERKCKYVKDSTPETPSYTEADLLNIDLESFQDMWSPNINIPTSSPKSKKSIPWINDTLNTNKNHSLKITKLDLTVACFFQQFSCLNKIPSFLIDAI